MSQEHALEGTSVGIYEVRARIGRGGMGEVYLARDTRLGRPVALKVLPERFALDERFRERLLRESRLAASLDHPNVVPVYDAGEADGRLFIAMRYVDGIDLKALLRDAAPLAPEADTTPVPGLTKDLSGKLFGDKGYRPKLAQELLHRGLILMTRVRSNMKSLPVSFLDKALLNGRNIAETIIGHIKEFSSLRLPKHRSVFNAFTHVTAAIIAYQIDPLPPRPIRVILP